MSSQVLLTPQIITKESLMILENNLVAANRVNRRFENKFSKIGATLTVRKPNRFTVASGATLQLKLLGLAQVSGNAFGEHAKWWVLINNHCYRVGQAGL